MCFSGVLECSLLFVYFLFIFLLHSFILVVIIHILLFSWITVCCYICIYSIALYLNFLLHCVNNHFFFLQKKETYLSLISFFLYTLDWTGCIDRSSIYLDLFVLYGFMYEYNWKEKRKILFNIEADENLFPFFSKCRNFLWFS